MKIQTGANYSLKVAEETQQGTSPASGYKDMPLTQNSIDSSIQQQDSSVIGKGRETQAPTIGSKDIGGSLSVPIDVNNIGLWLKGLLGSASVTGSGPYTHTFESGKDTLPSFSIEAGMPDANAYPIFKGCMIGGMQFSVQRNQEVLTQLEVLGMSHTENNATVDASSTALNYVPFNQKNFYMNIDGQPAVLVTDLSLNFSNNLEGIASISSGETIDGIQVQNFDVTGSISARYKDNTLLDKAEVNAPVEVECGFDMGNGNKLVFTLHQVHLSKAGREVTGPSGIDLQFDVRGAKNQALGKSLTVELTNDIASY